MTPEAKLQLKAMLIRHEGYKRQPYLDTVGKITIGIGYNLSDRGISDEWIMKQYDEDVEFFHDALQNDYPFFKDLSINRQLVLIDMAFMGYKKLQGFVRMFKALERGEYLLAAHEMLNSKWADQVGQRAKDLAYIMRMDSLDEFNQ